MKSVCGCDDQARPAGLISRRRLLAGVAAIPVMDGCIGAFPAFAAAPAPQPDLAPVATAHGSGISGVSSIDCLVRPDTPTASAQTSEGMWCVWADHGPQWVELRWSEPVRTDGVAVFWGTDGQEIALPQAAKLFYRDGEHFVPVAARQPLGLAGDRFNRLDFAPVRTDGLRLELEPTKGKSVGVMRWQVRPAGSPPPLAAAVDAGIDRSVVAGGVTYLSGRAGWVARDRSDGVRWSKASGPGEVWISDPTALEPTARFSRPGDYVLRLTATSHGRPTMDTVAVRVVAPPPPERLEVVYTTPYAVDNPLWNDRIHALVTEWIPHCVAFCERTDLPTGQGGIDNFIEAAKALRGEPHGPHKGFVFANAWVHQTVESMCLALMIDPQGDPAMLAAQARMRATLERWIPIILAAQEPDGYLQTAYTLASRKDWPEHWMPEHRTGHEGYTAGYFIESAINHHTLTGGKDLRLYDAARRLADCWVANIGPGKKAWFDGHQEMEQALVRFGRFVNDVEGGNRGDPYIHLARFLLDSRKGGTRYDQSHLPPVCQYEAVGHAVRAMYFYSGMADIAAETRDVDYQSAVASLWDNMVNRRYYVTGGVGSGDTAEGFGEDYGLRHDAYCESCSSCGLIFFQYKMGLAYHDARYADLYEETMYNALLGGVALDGKSFCYTNPLVGTERAQWHVCPCCVGNIPRTLLMLPTWAYAKRRDALFVNLFVGSRIQVGEIAGTRVEMVQATDYPWKGAVSITVNPATAACFALHVRMPSRATSTLYTATPALSGLRGMTVNGEAITPVIENGYAVISRTWRPGDRVAFEVPMEVQRITARDEVAATRGEVALRYGPLVYSFERADQEAVDGALGDGHLSAQWRPDLLGGVVAIEGRWRDGTPMRAVPYYARMNRTGTEPRLFPLSDGAVDTPKDADAMAQAMRLSRVWVQT